MTTVSNDAIDAARFEHATVQAITEGGVIAHGPRGMASARIAVGCLVEPEPGDRVLLSRADGECFVLSVLARESSGRRVRVDGRLTVSARELELRGEREACVASADRIGLCADRVEVASVSTEIRSRRLGVTGERGHAHFQQARLITSNLEILGERIVQCARTVTRRVEETEILHVGNLIQRIRETWLARSNRTSITAKGDVHVDGERIHMG